MLSVALKSGWPFEHFPQLDILEGGCPLIARSNRFLTYLGHHFKTQLPCMKHIDQRQISACLFLSCILHMRVDNNFCQGLADCDS